MYEKKREEIFKLQQSNRELHETILKNIERMGVNSYKTKRNIKNDNIFKEMKDSFEKVNFTHDKSKKSIISLPQRDFLHVSKQNSFSVDESPKTMDGRHKTSEKNDLNTNIIIKNQSERDIKAEPKIEQISMKDLISKIVPVFSNVPKPCFEFYSSDCDETRLPEVLYSIPDGDGSPKDSCQTLFSESEELDIEDVPKPENQKILDISNDISLDSLAFYSYSSEEPAQSISQLPTKDDRLISMNSIREENQKLLEELAQLNEYGESSLISNEEEISPVSIFYNHIHPLSTTESYIVYLITLSDKLFNGLQILK